LPGLSLQDGTILLIIANIGNVRETFFFNQLRAKHDIIMSPVADFLVDNYTFEVGCRSKGMQQIQKLENAFVVKDDIEHGFLNTIPLWQFVFLY